MRAYSAMLMAGIDGIINKIDPGKEGYGPFDINVFDMPEEERNKIKEKKEDSILHVSSTNFSLEA